MTLQCLAGQGRGYSNHRVYSVYWKNRFPRKDCGDTLIEISPEGEISGMNSVFSKCSQMTIPHEPDKMGVSYWNSAEFFNLSNVLGVWQGAMMNSRS